MNSASGRRPASTRPMVLLPALIGPLRQMTCTARSALAVLLDRIPDQRGDIGTAEALHLADAGRRSDIDLGQIVADHIDADEDETLGLQIRPQPFADLALALRQFGRLRAPAHMHVGAV